MKKWFSNLTKDQLQRFLFLGALVLVFSVFFIALGINSSQDKKPDDGTQQPDGNGGTDSGDKDNNSQLPDNDGKNENNTKPQTFILPTKSEDYAVVRKYYSTQSSKEDQELAVIQYGKRYFVSTGVALQNKDGSEFDVVAALDGVVESVEDSPIYGVVIVLKHESEVFTEYSSLSKTNVSVGDTVKQGDVIGVSGTCEYDSELLSHVYFKVSKNSQTYDPLNIVGLEAAEVK